MTIPYHGRLCLLLATCPAVLSAMEANPAEPNQQDSLATSVENLLVTGSRLAGSVENVPAHVTVIDRKLIEARGDQSVVDLLRSVAGLQVSQNGGRGGVTSVFLRGAEANFTAVYLDGVRVNDPNNTRGGSFDFSNINSAEIERIEIIRGAQSAVYGSDGLAGVINIITRQATEKFAGSLTAELGQDDYWRLGGTIGGALGEVSHWSLTGSAVDDGTAIEGNGFDGQALDARLTSQPTDRANLELSLRYFESAAEAFPEDSGGPELAEIREVDERDLQQMSFSGLFGYRLAERWSMHAQLGYLDQEEQSDSPGVAEGVRSGVPPNSSDSNLERININTYALFEANQQLSATAGLSWEEERGDVSGEV